MDAPEMSTQHKIKKTPILRRQEKLALPIPALVAPPLFFRLFVRLRTFVASGISGYSFLLLSIFTG
jgi:hypothetical protein